MTYPLIRRTPITHKEIENSGATPGCVGCEAKARGESTRRGHSDKCRRRIEEAMRNDEQDKKKIDKADERLAHNIAKDIEKSERERKWNREFMGTLWKIQRPEDIRRSSKE